MTATSLTVEARCRAWIESLGDLSEWRQVLAADALVLARLLDAEIDPAKAAAGSRELRQIVGLLAPVASLGAPVRPEGWSRPEEPVDLVGNVVDMVERKQGGGRR